jgi:hypothetical protein
MSKYQKTEMVSNIEYRIREQLKAFGNNLPESYAIAWRGYLAGLFEWKLLDYRSYSDLVDLLPLLSEPNPVAHIFIFEDPTQNSE